MGTKQFSNYESLLTFTRASKGHALRPVSYGTELVTNGDFATDSDWTKEASWTISGGTATYDGAVHVETLFQNISLTTGKIIKISYTVKNVEAGKTAYFNVVGSPNASPLYKQYTNHTEGDYEIIATVEAGAVGLGFFALNSGTGGAFDLDNVSVKEVLFDQPDGTLTLFEHPDNIPRVEYDADGNRLGLLVEEARTNLWLHSQDMSEASLGGAGGTVTTDQYVAPDGTQTGDLVTMNSGELYVYRGMTLSSPSNVAFTVSCYVKAVEANTSVNLRIGEFGGAAGAKFHDSGNTAISSTEWTRLDFTQTLEQSDRTQVQAVIRTTSQTSSLLIWGVQLEQGSFPTSYIKTTSSTATRSSELADVLVDNFGYNNSNEGTFVIHAKNLSYNPNGTDYPFLVRFDNATNSNDRLGIFLSEASGNLVAEIKRNNVTQMSPVFKTATGGAVDEIVVAFAFAENDFAVSDDGDAVITDTAGTLVPSSPIAKIGLGQAFNSVHMNAHITSFQYYPRRLTNAQIEDLSS